MKYDRRVMSPVNAIVAIRGAIGAVTWLTPRLSGRVFGLDAGANPQLPYVARLFAARDLALAAGLRCSQGDAQRLWLQIGIACDAADAVAGILAGRRGELSALSTARVTAPALAGVRLGLVALRGADTRP